MDKQTTNSAADSGTSVVSSQCVDENDQAGDDPLAKFIAAILRLQQRRKFEWYISYEDAHSLFSEEAPN